MTHVYRLDPNPFFLMKTCAFLSMTFYKLCSANFIWNNSATVSQNKLAMKSLLK